MPLLARLPLLFAAALLVASCSAGPVSPTRTPPLSASSASSVSITATALASRPASPPFGCPVATPFAVPLVVTVTPTGAVTVFVTSITTQFTDVSGVTMPQVTLPAPIPTTQFGTALEQAKNLQTFAFDVCRPSPRGAFAVTVNMQGLPSRTLMVPVN